MSIARARVFALCLVAGAAYGGESADPGFVWCVQDADNSVCLAGSIHLLPPSAYPLPAVYGQVYEQAEILAFETDIGKLQSSEVQTRLYHARRYPAGAGLQDHLSAALFAKLAGVADEMGLSLSTLLRFRPWAVAGMIEMQGFAAQDFRQSLGVDAHFYQRARDAGKTILALETLSHHLDLLTGMPAELAKAYLGYTVAHAKELADVPEQLYVLWRAGNAMEIAALTVDQLTALPKLYERLLYQRNRAWMDDIVALINGDENAMVIVGALHLIGKKGLLALLRERGYTVSRARQRT